VYGSCADIPIKKEKLILKQIKAIRAYNPASEIIISTGFLAENIIGKYDNVRCVENINYTEHGQAESLRLALNANISDKVCIILGNTIFTHKTITAITERNSLSVKQENTSKKFCRRIGVIHQDDIALSMAFRSSNSWNGIIYIEDNTLIELKKILSKSEKNLECYEVFNQIINDNFAVIYQNDVVSINSVEDLK
jgi:hypothetical protein